MTKYNLTAQAIKLAHIEHPKLAKWYSDYLQSPEWAALRAKIYDIAKGSCERCGISHGKMCTHHKTYEHVGAELPSELILVCEPCHVDLHYKTIIPYAERIYDETYQPPTKKKRNKTKR